MSIGDVIDTEEYANGRHLRRRYVGPLLLHNTGQHTNIAWLSLGTVIKMSCSDPNVVETTTKEEYCAWDGSWNRPCYKSLVTAAMVIGSQHAMK